MPHQAGRQFRRDIQGLRAFAVVVVIFDHADFPGVPGGFIGVDVFFVISGFLITSQMLRSLQKHGRINFLDFYAKRFRRILPASLVVLVATLFAAYALAPPLKFEASITDAIATALYVPNLVFAREGTDYLANPDPSLFQHYWSLGVEEQFYLLWPLLLSVAFVSSRRRLQGVFWVLTSMVVISFALCVVLTIQQQPWAFFLPVTRFWELGVGAMLAFIVREDRAPSGRAAAGASFLGVCGLGGSLVVIDHSTQFPGAVAALPVLATAALIWAGSASVSAVQRLLGLAPLVWVGEISYSLYLVHWPIFLLASDVILSTPDEKLPLAVRAIAAVACLPVAWLLYWGVEARLRHARWLVARRPGATLISALVATSLAVAMALAGANLSSTRPLFVAQDAERRLLSASPAGTDFVPANLRPGLRAVRGDLPAIVTNGCHLQFRPTEPSGCQYGDPTTASHRVVLFGDSHAAQWFPGLAEAADARGWALKVHTKNACAPADVNRLSFGKPYTECGKWRQNVIDQILADPPDLVVISGFRRVLDRETFVDQNTSPEIQWNAALSRTISSLAESGTRVVHLTDTPTWRFDPTECLSKHLQNATTCWKGAMPTLSLDQLHAEQRTVTAAGGIFVNLGQYLCDDSNCPMIIGDTLVYRDFSHLSATFSRQMAPKLGDAVERAF